MVNQLVAKIITVPFCRRGGSVVVAAILSARLGCEAAPVGCCARESQKRAAGIDVDSHFLWRSSDVHCVREKPLTEFAFISALEAGMYLRSTPYADWLTTR